MPSADAVSATSSASQNLYPQPWERGSKKGSENITIRPKGDKFGEKFGEHHKFDRREINSVKSLENIVRLFEEHSRSFEEHSRSFEEHSRLFEEHSNSIWCGSQTKDESKRNGQNKSRNVTH